MLALALLAPMLLASAPPPDSRSWEGGAAFSYAKTDELQGFNANARGLYLVHELFAAGLSVDFASLHDSGIAQNGERYTFDLRSALVAGIAQFRLPLGPVVPFAELAIGAAINDSDGTNIRCTYSSSLGLGAATGINVELMKHFDVGLRAAARFPGGMGCADVPGPYAVNFGPIYSLGASVALRL